ncbi:hypothetical protein LIX60_30875 [Streptomyces sp. S07_1.15]|uniref:hypothetical protein n=1 Tax=Streptomyces sp. S07_1.15 TaxID=2873925 RepID=UPI001D13894F|nr:hypothetical protein [Streptomyces sp. S07_1.15]MCC3655787.1 hypothetical protein [Streptomyces sp. S07_1.15]
MKPRALGAYRYWSQRRVEEFAGANGIDLSRKKHAYTSPQIPCVGQWQTTRERMERTRYEITQQITRKVGHIADRALTEPPRAWVASGKGEVEFALYSGAAPRPEVLLHTRDRDAAGRRVDVILFGSLDNTGYRPGDAEGPGHTPSSWWAVRDLLASRGREHGWGDDEEMAVEALAIALAPGEGGPRAEGEPRESTLARVADCHWCAEVYLDIELDHDRWHPIGEPGMEDVHRIVVGAPMWARVGGQVPIRRPHRWWSRRRRPSSGSASNAGSARPPTRP